MTVTDSGAAASSASQPGRGSVGGPSGSPGGGRRPPSKRGRWFLLGAFVIAALFVVWIIVQSKQPAATGGPGGGPAGAAGGRGGRGGGRGGGAGGITSVNVAKATIQDMPIYLSALGTVTPEATVTVRTQIAGQLFSVAFREGQTVRKGQLLAQVDPRPYQQALAQAQGNLTRDLAQLANARLDLQRYQTLLSQDSIARQQVDTQARSRAPGRGRHRHRQGRRRRRQAEPRLHPHHRPGGREGGAAAGRSRQLRDDGGCERPRHHHPDRPDRRGVHRARGQRGPRERPHGRGGQDGGRGLRSWDEVPARHRRALDARQPDRHHHRHGEGQGAVLERGGRALSEPVRQRPAARGHPARGR